MSEQESALADLTELPDMQLDSEELMAIDSVFDNYVSELGARGRGNIPGLPSGLTTRSVLTSCAA